MVHIKQGALRPFKQQITACMMRVVQLTRHIGHHRLQKRCVLHGFVIHRLKLHLSVGHVGLQAVTEVELFGVQKSGQHMVVQGQKFTQLAGKAFGVLQVLHPQGASRNFVFISRANAASCGANFFGPALLAGSFSGDVKCCMERQDERARLADAQARTHFDTGFFQALNLFKQFGCRQHHPIADVALDAGAHDATWDQVQGGFDAIDDQGVTSVVAALKTHHALGAFGEPINQLALALVAPLGTHHHHMPSVLCHHGFINSMSLLSQGLNRPTP